MARQILMRKMAVGVMAIAALALSGCAHSVLLIPRDGGPNGVGQTDSGMGQSGTLTVSLDGKTYTGPWVFAAQGGFFGVGSAYGSGGFATGSMTGVGTSGGGRADLRSSDGQTIRCQFQYDQMGRRGFGDCESGTGRKFDLHIH